MNFYNKSFSHKFIPNIVSIVAHSTEINKNLKKMFSSEDCFPLKISKDRIEGST